MTASKVATFFGLTILLIIVFYFIWWKLPVTINRHNDIEFANKIISKIDIYQTTNELPESNNWEILKLFGFKDNKDFLSPEYTKIDANTYELVFVEGFDGPYLMWNSEERKWKIGNPTIVHHKGITKVK